MRQLTRSDDKNFLKIFSDFLYSKEIESQVDASGDGFWELWVLDDDKIESAQSFWVEYENDPGSEKFQAGARKGEQLFQQEKKKAEKNKAKIIDGRTAVTRTSNGEFPFLTVGAITLSVGIFALGMFDVGVSDQIFDLLAIQRLRDGFLPEVFSGQVWRILTPAFMHGSFFHLFFNMYWMAMLGPRIERTVGWQWFAALFLGTAILPNMAQYIFTGPNFLGMSGVVYGLIGFAWLAQKRRPTLFLGIDKGLWMFAMVWMGLGFLNAIVPIFGGMLNVANYAHLGGLLVGFIVAEVMFRIGKLPLQN